MVMILSSGTRCEVIWWAKATCSDCTRVLKNPSLLILDEATSALDLENERYIQEALQTLAADRTTIIIAHRLATITHVDTIIYIEDGEIKETGSHEELMKKRILPQFISTSTYNRNSSFSVKGAVFIRLFIIDFKFCFWFMVCVEAIHK